MTVPSHSVYSPHPSPYPENDVPRRNGGRSGPSSVSAAWKLCPGVHSCSVETNLRPFTGSLPRTVLGRSNDHVSSPASSRLSYGPGFAVDEVVHDHEIAGGSMVAVRHVGCLRTEGAVSGSDVDRRHEGRREPDADE